MFRREGEEINGCNHKHSQTPVQERRSGDKWMDLQAFTSPVFRREGEKINGWIHKHSQTLIQERRIGDKWMDSQALTCSG
jgi:hypothetical protein